VAGLQVVCTQQIGAVLFLDELTTGVKGYLGKDKVFQRASRFNLKEKVQYMSILSCWRRLRVWTVPALLEVACQTVSQYMMLFGPFFGYQGLKCLPEERLVSACTRSNEVKKKIGSGHHLTFWPGYCRPSGTPFTQTRPLTSKNLNSCKGPIFTRRQALILYSFWKFFNFA
jgi:hypothetical protein